ncbi:MULTISPECIES: CRISPR-associated protein Csx20 [Raineya]|uniref:CRISPR-associated protein n=1 Tax=Raineya orbicola TaxID=2016530 RepID=A0A2N3IBM6_9BACT|nr:CRISPR-associated protein Csx20 [Raineya orbicola]PKQ67668.1 hypothetical protein Rain11_1943 [Raineya orbicola]
MAKIFLLFSHKLTEQQETELRKDWGIREIWYLPDNLQTIWSNVNPEVIQIRESLEVIFDFLQKNATPNDYVLVQGDYGAVVLVVQWCWKKGLIPLYGTTQRVAQETREGEHIRVERIFRHCRFRKYEKLINH